MEASRFAHLAVLPLIAVELAGTCYLIVDAAGGFSEPAGQRPPYWGFPVAGWLGLFATVFAGPLLALVLSPGRQVLGWLLAPLCAAFLVAFFYSYDHGADGYVPRYSNEHPGLGIWVAGVGAVALLVAVLTYFRPRSGLACTGLVAFGSLSPIIGIALAGH